MMKKAMVVFAAAALFFGCQQPTDSNKAVTAVAVTPATASVLIGGFVELNVAFTPADATNKDVTYTTSDAAVATVSAKGVVTGVAAGSATITVTSNDGKKTATSAITVTSSVVAVESVALKPAANSVNVGASVLLEVEFTPATATNKSVTFSTSNAAVATVSDKGLVTGVAIGDAEITVTSADGAKTAKATVTVAEAAGVGGWAAIYRDPTNTAGTYIATRTLNDGKKEGLLVGRFVSKSTITLTADTTWYLNGVVYIGDNNESANPQGDVELVIEAGTVVKGLDNGTQPGTLVITRGSKIKAEGTAEKPIVFTSSKQKGARAPGDTGGIVIQGQAPINEGFKADGSGTKEVKTEFDTGLFGGDKEDDNSGIMKYVRIEYSGRLFTADKELNGLSLMGVGNGTTLSHIQIHLGSDDGIEMFGGTVNMDHIIVTGALDDTFDWTSGWKGTAQFVVLHQYFNADSNAALGDKGIEGDNYSKGFNYTPRSNPTLANFTIIGRKTTGSSAVNIRVGSYATMWNSLVTGFATGLKIDNTADADDTKNTKVTFKGVLLATTAQGNVPTGSSFADGSAFDADASKLNIGASTLDGKAVSGAYPAAYKPTAAITAATAQTLPAGLSPATYIGAVDPAGTDWTTGWTNYDAN